MALQCRPIVATFIQQSDDPKVQIVKGYGLRAYACNPLMAGDKLFGTLSFASRSRDEFDPSELDFFQTLCRYAAAAFERRRLVAGLREADRKKDEFLATLAHELRNPLAPIRNAVEFLRMKGPQQPDLENIRDMIDRQVRQMTRLVDDLLDVSRISRGKISLQKQRVSLSLIVSNAVEACRPMLESQGHTLEVALPPEPLYLEGDTTRLTQVFVNLFNNAAKYTPAGGHVWLTVERQGSDVVVRVKDDGSGIPATMLTRIFEMFVQVDRSLERTTGGLGIGLTLVQKIVDMHGGRIEAHSEGPGKGSEFVVRLPLTVGAGAETGGGHPVSYVTPLRILIVDDNRDAADSLAMMLRLKGHEVYTAYDGIQAVETANSLRPDVALLDIGMPRLNGYEAARRIRTQPWAKAVVLVALTGWGQEEDKRLAEEAGFNSHFTKPVDTVALESLLAGVGAVRKAERLEEPAR